MRNCFKGNTGMLAALLILMNLSCTEIVEIDLDSTYTRLVVEGGVTNDSVYHRVQLSLTSDYFSNQPSPRVSDALVFLEFKGTTLQMVEQDSVPGLYLSPYAFRGEIGTTYSLEILQVDVDQDGISESYHASSTMPGGVTLDSISLSYFSSYFGSGYQVFMFALDPPSEDWYGLKFWKNSDLLTDTLIKYSVQPDDFYNGKYLFYGIPIGYYSDGEPREKLQPGDTVTLELNSIERAYYDFVGDAQLEIWGNNPLFSGPPANIRSNIDNGAMGVFTAYSIQRTSAVIPEP